MSSPSLDAGAALATARSFLFVPGIRAERFAKALASGADAVIIDLEDAVAPADKATARGLLADALGQFSQSERARLLERMNAHGTPWHDDDLTLLALLESVAGLDAANALAQAPQVLRLAFGNLDFQADAGLACGPDEAELQPVRLAVLLASRRAGLASPVDGVMPGTQDSALLQAAVARSRRGGFGAKLCIHPAQVAAVNAAFTPGEAELAWALRVVVGFDAAGGGVFSLDGRMVDAPVLRLAQRTLAQSRPSAPA